MLSITPCPNGWELAKVPGFEPGSRGSKPLMLSATPYLHAVPMGTAVALKGATADQLPTSIHSSTAFTEGLFEHIMVVECVAPHVLPSLVKCHLSVYLFKVIRFMFKQIETRMNHILIYSSPSLPEICEKHSVYPI